MESWRGLLKSPDSTDRWGYESVRWLLGVQSYLSRELWRMTGKHLAEGRALGLGAHFKSSQMKSCRTADLRAFLSCWASNSTAHLAPPSQEKSSFHVIITSFCYCQQHPSWLLQKSVRAEQSTPLPCVVSQVSGRLWFFPLLSAILPARLLPDLTNPVSP